MYAYLGCNDDCATGKFGYGHRSAGGCLILVSLLQQPLTAVQVQDGAHNIDLVPSFDRLTLVAHHSILYVSVTLPASLIASFDTNM